MRFHSLSLKTAEGGERCQVSTVCMKVAPLSLMCGRLLLLTRLSGSSWGCLTRTRFPFSRPAPRDAPFHQRSSRKSRQWRPRTPLAQPSRCSLGSSVLTTPSRTCFATPGETQRPAKHEHSETQLLCRRHDPRKSTCPTRTCLSRPSSSTRQSSKNNWMFHKCLWMIRRVQTCSPSPC